MPGSKSDSVKFLLSRKKIFSKVLKKFFTKHCLFLLRNSTEHSENCYRAPPKKRTDFQAMKLVESLEPLWNRSRFKLPMIIEMFQACTARPTSSQKIWKLQGRFSLFSSGLPVPKQQLGDFSSQSDDKLLYIWSNDIKILRNSYGSRCGHIPSWLGGFSRIF